MGTNLSQFGCRFATLFLLALTSALPAAGVTGSQITTVQIAGGLTDPIGVTHAGDGSGRLFIVEQHGRIRIWTGGQLLATPFLDISSLVGPCPAPPNGCGEQGLLGLAFHPDYETNGFFYVYYTRNSAVTSEDGDIVVARYQVSANPNVANASGDVLLVIEHSLRGNHNGGQLAFGPDGYLYLGVGDGGGGGDPDENGQNITTLLGKILRIDVDGDDFPGEPNRDYAIPGGNPFVGVTGADEVWDYGLRNPWRFSFDRSTGDLYIGDVGQGFWEEIDLHAATSPGGTNYGWDCREGAHDYTDSNGDGNSICGAVTSVDPILEYDHSLGCSVTGGFVFRNLPGHTMSGNYFYGDFCSGRIWRGIRGTGGTWTSSQISDTGFGISSFGESETGRLYFTDLFGDTLQWLAPYTFLDVPPIHWAWPFVEALSANGITIGCDGVAPNYCPGNQATRAEMAVFLVRAIHGSAFVPPPATGIFADVPPGHPAAPYIEQLHAEGITKGCAVSPLRYCPDNSLNRAEMAPFLLRVRHGGNYVPPPVSSTSFADVPADFWAAPWIEQLFREGITTGCALSPRRYCPDALVNRAEVAGFLARTFSLPLP